MIYSACVSLARALRFCLMRFGEGVERFPSRCLPPYELWEALSSPQGEGRRWPFGATHEKSTVPSDY